MKVVISLILIFLVFSVKAQKARDVLEHGKRIKSGQKLFLAKDGNVLKYDINTSLDDLTPLPDSTIFLVEKEEVNIFLKPLNPLNFSYKTSNIVVVDPVSEEESTASNTIFEQLSKMLTANIQGEQGTATNCTLMSTIQATMKKIQDGLNDNQKDKINKIFKDLQGLDFEDQKITEEAVAKILTDITQIEKHFEQVDNLFKELGKQIDSSCEAADNDITFVVRYTLRNMSKEMQAIETDQKKRLTNLNAVYKLVNDAKTQAAKGKGNVKWVFPLESAPATQGKVSIYTITIYKSGYELSGDNEIVASETKEVMKRTMRVRKFQRFIPEVSGGIAYTFFEYPEYGTGKDAAGNIIVSEIRRNTVRNLKFTAMINYNFFLTNSPIHPFWQLGIGANSEVPTFFTGIGIRSNMNGLRRIAVAGGISGTWIKQLTDLSVGKPIAGTIDLENDLKYQFYWPLKPYIAFQINF